MSCCVVNCFVKHGHGVPLHRLVPNPITDQERFREWVRKIGGEVATLEQSFVFKNRRICHKHFDTKYYGSKNRLSKIAVPSICEPDDVPVVASTSQDCYVPVTEVTALPKVVKHATAALSKRSVSMSPYELTLKEIITNLKKQVQFIIMMKIKTKKM